MTFCGDGVCEDGERDCTLKEGGCTPECCGEPSCCLGGAENSTTSHLTVVAETNSGMNLHVVLVLTVTMMMNAVFLVL